MICAKEFIKNGFSADDAAKLDSVIKPLYEKGEKIVVDFSEISIFTTLFFNNVFAKYILEIGPEKFNNIFCLENLSELGKTTYEHSVQNAIRYYNSSDENKRKQDEIVEEPED